MFFQFLQFEEFQLEYTCKGYAYKRRMYLTFIDYQSLMSANANPTNTPRVFQVEKTWKRSFPRRFKWNTRGVFVGKYL